ncbi:protein turtle-like isoform X2 [Culicoides brevitarsis]|uniref:protein turtle-like isoform X2 n=1 Tax=Culicoides brevitarsis TaxID=469753 RepID=UPI00307C6AB8
MGVRADPGSSWWYQAISRVQYFTTNTLIFILSTIVLSINSDTAPNTNNPDFIPAPDAIHTTAILGESVIFNCHVEFPGDHPVPYVLQWEKKGQEIPIYIWYESYPTHSGEGYEGRVSRVSPDSPFGAASLNLTNIRESDQGWYECKVVFLNRSPNQHKNGTWFHLDVHAPPRFSVTPEDIIYVNLGDSIILNCQAEGTPTPEILWYKDANPVDPSSTVGIFNDGTELRISTIRDEDIGDYTCIARNGEGQVSHTARVIIAGGANIVVPPTNQTKLEGEKAQFTCEAKAMPGNVTVRWFREGTVINKVSGLESRITIRKDGSLIINPVSADDTGMYTCEVTNGIGDPQSAGAYLNVEYPAKVTFNPTVQYLPFRLAGVVQCFIKSNPALQYVTWTKDKRLLEPYQSKDVVVMNNGSLLFTRVTEDHQGRYTCTPYNAQGTKGSSEEMDVLVREPPTFTVEPQPLYQRKIDETVEMACQVKGAEGTTKPTIKWQRSDGVPLQKNRAKISGGNLTITGLKRSDFGYYQCVASNEVATIMSSTQLVIEGTQPHAPYNVTVKATEFSVSISWMPGYSGGPDYKQDYVIWYREGGATEWNTIPVTPSGSTQVSINGLRPGILYEFKVVGKNTLGDGMMSKPVTIRTLDIGGKNISKGNNKEKDKQTTNEPKPPQPPQSATQTTTESNVFKTMPDEAGPKPGQPRNLTVTEIANGFLLTWQTPLDRPHLVQYYTIKYRTDAQWKTLNRGQIRPEETSYLVKNLVGGRTYYFRILANSAKSFESSDEVKFPVPARVKHKAITAGVVGGILFFIVAIILSVCAVKICNKRKRRKQEKELNMVACRTTDMRNSAASLGVGLGPVPVKTDKEQTRIPGLKYLISIYNAIRTSEICYNFLFIKSHGDNSINLGSDVYRMSSNKRNSFLSDYSSSDDGGFLPRKRRPIVSCPSQLSFQSIDSNQSNYSRLLKRFNLHHLHQMAQHAVDLHRPTVSQAIQTLYRNVNDPLGHATYVNTPLRGPTKILSSSPASHLAAMSPPYFSDLSSVNPSSADHSHQQATPNNRSFQDRYFHTLPRLHAISEENNRFIPVQIPTPASVEGNFYQNIHNFPLRSMYDFRSRHNPLNRSKRSLPDTSFPLLNIAHHFLDNSPSDSSGFGSKNTSSNLNQSSHSSGMRFLPPYRPPPAPSTLQRHIQSPSQSVSHWFDLIARLRASSEKSNRTKSFDVGSVDGHYEFDPSTPTPEIGTPTLLELPDTFFMHHHAQRKRNENIDARVQAMKEEYHAWRQSQSGKSDNNASMRSTDTLLLSEDPSFANIKLETVC